MSNHHPLRRWRFEHDITLDELANNKRLKSRISVPHLSRIERGLNYPGIELRRLLSSITGIPVDKFTNWSAK